MVVKKMLGNVARIPAITSEVVPTRTATKMERPGKAEETQ
jgi:hypothetical protein